MRVGKGNYYYYCISLLLAGSVLLGSGCGVEPLETAKEQECKGKCEMINRYNDPAKLGFTIQPKLADPSLIGQTLRSSFTPYSPPTYFPFTGDGINRRASSKDPSPAEKFDLAFSSWKPEESFWSLKKLSSTSDKEFDQEYYDKLGPVAKWEHENHGLGQMHDGLDNDKNGKTDLEDTGGDGLQSWFGYCNGNTAASISVEGPLHAVTHQEIEFQPNDIMALLAAVYYDDRSTVTGLRCNAESTRKDEYGRLVDQPWYRLKSDAGNPVVTFIVVNGPYWTDNSRTKVGYRIVVDRDGRLDFAVVQLTYEEFGKYKRDAFNGEISFDEGQKWEEIEFSTEANGCRDTNPATLYLAVTHLLGKYKIPFAIDADSGSHVWNYPIYEAIIEEQRIIERQEANKLLELAENQIYPFNSSAQGFAYVSLKLTESHQMSLQMILELDKDQNVIGGEWVGRSKTSHPDFIWMAMGADSTGFNTEGTYVTFGDDQLDYSLTENGMRVFTDAPKMRYSDVRLLLAQSRTTEKQSFSVLEGEAGVKVGRGETRDLPVEFNDETHPHVGEALVYLDLKAADVPAVKLTLVAPDDTEVKLFDIPSDTSGLPAGREPVGAALGEIRGVAHPMPLVDSEGNVIKGLERLKGLPAIGKWILRVKNASGSPVAVNQWKLWLTAATE